MQINNKNECLYSATDLTHFLACHHLTFLDLQNLSVKMDKTENSAFNKLLQEKGYQHENEYLINLKKQFNTIVEIPKNIPLEERFQLTVESLKSGADVIFQGVFYVHPWRGDADFLVKVSKPSKLGAFSYEVVDTKLAKNPEPKHLIQLCFYTDLLSNIQGVKSENMHLVLGDGKQITFKYEDYFHYYSKIKLRFDSFVQFPPVSSYPEPCEYCKFCDWKDSCAKQWESDQHLSLVANIRRSQIEKLKKSDINSVLRLASSHIDMVIPDLNSNVFQKLQSQATLQMHKIQSGDDKFEIIPFKTGQGFERMPKPDTGDIFFDMEGDPLYPKGLEYLFGMYFLKNKEEIFQLFWGHDPEQEREAFKEFMKFIDVHLNSHPDAHIYHYNHYETTALKRLACKYSIAEEQLDNLLRQKKFVDLYQVVRESIRTSEPGYSIKNIETFYMEKRSGNVATAMDSIIVYNEWRETQDDSLLDQISQYNEVDCISTCKLRNWLLSIRPAECVWFKNEVKIVVIPVRNDWEVEYELYRENLLTNTSAANFQLRKRISDLLEFHKREENSKWWSKFERQNKLVEELIEDAECLGGLTLVSGENTSIYTYHFPPQEYKLREGDQVVDTVTIKSIGTIIQIDNDNGIVKIRRSGGASLSDSLSISAYDIFNTDAIRAAIYRVATSVLNSKKNYSAVLDILNKSIPRISTKTAGESIISSKDTQAAIIQVICNLNESYLFIQGPPGAGKTHTSAHIIVELMRQGKKIGVTTNSHKAIHNLLDKIEEVALSQGFKFSGIHKSSSANKDSVYRGRYINSENNVKKINLNVLLISGTVWLFSDERFNEALDYLFIDEAGQVSVANVVAMGTSTKNIILVGDQMQLGQPIKAVHPGEAGESILEFLLGDHATIPSDRGIFLDHTRRLSSSICDFISKAFYDNRLAPYESNDKRYLVFKEPIAGITNTGIHLIRAEHAGCSQKSIEEGIIIKKYYALLSKQILHDKDGVERALTPADILVVTPYNVQVNYLKSILPKEARVGTVDKFQGQEAPIVLVSMVASSAEELPRSLEFLYSRNRLNVALSRAQCLAVVVINQKLFEIPCNTGEQMRLVNTFCWLDEYASQDETKINK